MNPPTDADLRAAWQRCKPMRSPMTFETAAADPVIRRVLEMSARQHAAPAAPEPAPRACAHPLPTLRPMADALDIKRRAAGDTDE